MEMDAGNTWPHVVFSEEKRNEMARLTVLVVDDEPGIRSGITRILRDFSVGYPFMEEDYRFDLKEAETGEQAMAIAEREQVDIFLLDNKLPGMQGIEVLEHLNRTKYDADVMMITSYASLDLAVKATNNGAYNFVPKPFTPQELKAAMENITKHLILRRMTSQMTRGDGDLRQQFLAVLSHELKSPINAIEGYLQIMSERQAGQELENYQVMIERSMERLRGMRSLIHDLLDLTRLDGKREKELTMVDLADVLRLAKDIHEPLARSQQVRMNPVEAEGVYVKAEKADVEMICNNLISNAVKYNRPGGEVSVAIRQEKEGTVLSVKDTGIGMTGEEMTRLFGEFVRIRNSRTRHITGSGLGLSIVKKLVESYGGSIEVNSVPDEGSEFIVKLPA